MSRALTRIRTHVFVARRGYYRAPVVEALTQSEPTFISLIAAEHTAQLNAAQVEDVFSQAENHEIRFQDIDLAWRDTDAHEPAIDVLSSTTTMEVGIDIGELSGVALRNMPPGRANYQQRAGRAGRRGTAVATVTAFGSADSHDDHYFVSPDEMIRGRSLILASRSKTPTSHRGICGPICCNDTMKPEFQTLILRRTQTCSRCWGTFTIFGPARAYSIVKILGRGSSENRDELAAAANRWLPRELSPEDRGLLIRDMALDVVEAVDEAIGFTGTDSGSPDPKDAAPTPSGRR